MLRAFSGGKRRADPVLGVCVSTLTPPAVRRNTAKAGGTLCLPPGAQPEETGRGHAASFSFCTGTLPATVQ